MIEMIFNLTIILTTWTEITIKFRAASSMLLVQKKIRDILKEDDSCVNSYDSILTGLWGQKRVIRTDSCDDRFKDLDNLSTVTWRWWRHRFSCRWRHSLAIVIVWRPTFSTTLLHQMFDVKSVDQISDRLGFIARHIDGDQETWFCNKNFNLRHLSNCLGY